mmetsp:Transcript_35796/g.101298  ORF Transcript_35796/g.101298 Transcript_35796/m.101298 type:complete len:229 (-) Transcript_35796:81-767(-)
MAPAGRGRAGGTVPWTSVGLGPLQDPQVPCKGSGNTSLLCPSTPLDVCPLKDVEVAGSGCCRADLVAPHEAMGARPLQQGEVPASCSGHTDKRILLVDRQAAGQAPLQQADASAEVRHLRASCCCWQAREHVTKKGTGDFRYCQGGGVHFQANHRHSLPRQARQRHVAAPIPRLLARAARPRHRVGTRQSADMALTTPPALWYSIPLQMPRRLGQGSMQIINQACFFS